MRRYKEGKIIFLKISESSKKKVHNTTNEIREINCYWSQKNGGFGSSAIRTNDIMKKDTFELDLEECSEFHSVEMGYVCVGDMT